MLDQARALDAARARAEPAHEPAGAQVPPVDPGVSRVAVDVQDGPPVRREHPELREERLVRAQPRVEL